MAPYGPVGVLAAVLATIIAVALSLGWQRAAFHEAGHFRRSVAPLRAPVKFLTLPVQLSVLSNDRTLPIYGSSELYCCGDPYRPTQLFASQPTGFDVFVFGRYGIGNLLYA
jgi:poly-D-alanine transfer protein DltD